MQYLIAAGFVVLAIIVFFLINKSLKFLKTDIGSYYSFDLSLAGSGKWSLIFFFIIIAILGLVFLVFSQANFTLAPV